MNAVEETGIGGLDIKVIHGFIKGDMLSSLDSLSLHIKVQNILHSLGEAKEDTNSCIREGSVRAFGTRGKSINTAAKTRRCRRSGFLPVSISKGDALSPCGVTLYKRRK
jgi:hypothetical protein